MNLLAVFPLLTLLAGGLVLPHKACADGEPPADSLRRAGLRQELAADTLFLRSASALPDSLAAADSLSGASSLPDSLGAAGSAVDSLALAPADSVLQLPRRPDPWIDDRSLPVAPGLPRPGWDDRPSEDLADRLLELVPGPLEDWAQIHHPQYLALDGLDPRAMRLDLEGEQLHNRWSGLTDLRWMAGEMLAGESLDPWDRLGAQGGVLRGSWPRAADSVFVRVDWSDGFLGHVPTDIRAERPLGRGHLGLGTRQVYTHERVPGATVHGNLFWGNWEHPLPGGWRLRLDRRNLREKGLLLDTSRSRRLFQTLLRARAWQERSDAPWRLALDAQRRWDREDFAGGVDLRSEFRRLQATLLRDAPDSLDRGAQRSWVLLEKQFLSGDSLKKELGEIGLGARWRQPVSHGVHSVAEGEIAVRDMDNETRWRLALQLDGPLPRPLEGWQLVFARGRSLPWPDQLWRTVVPGEQNPLRSPWLRDTGGSLLPDSSLAGWQWQRQELRLHGRWSLPWSLDLAASLRGWRASSSGEPQPRAVGNGDYRWTPVEGEQLGAQLFLDLAAPRDWRLQVSQGWFPEDGEAISREYPLYLLDARLSKQRRFFSEELLVRGVLGLHYESGGTDSAGNSLWEAPEPWVRIDARRGRFTLWWALRNPFDAVLQRVEGRPHFGHEEWIGVRWDFVD